MVKFHEKRVGIGSFPFPDFPGLVSSFVLVALEQIEKIRDQKINVSFFIYIFCCVSLGNCFFSLLLSLLSREIVYISFSLYIPYIIYNMGYTLGL